jgi:hypothetical protein
MTDSLPDPMKAIMGLNRIDPKSASFDDLKQEMAKISDGIIAVSDGTGNEVFFRARKSQYAKPQNISELGPPPADKVIGFQRCNGPGEPMFYTGSRRVTALLETRVKPGDLVYLSQWGSIDPGIGINVTLDPSTIIPTDNPWFDRSKVVISYFDTLFTRRIHQTYSDDYRFTAAITSVLTKNLPVNHGSGSLVYENFGLRYASVVDVAKSYNTVFYPEHLRKLRPIHVSELRIDNVSNHGVSATLLDNAIKFGSSGDIQWTGDLTLFPVKKTRHGNVLYRDNGLKLWDIHTIDKYLTQNEFDEILNE